MPQSIEPIIAQKANGWLEKMNLNYKMEQDSANPEIGKALRDYESKSGGKGGNRPDAQLLITDKKGNHYPILIEYKGQKDKLIKVDKEGKIENKTSKSETHFTNISGYAVNGAIHYSNALLHHTSYTEIIAIGMTGYKDTIGKIHYQIGVYYVSKDNFGMGQKINDYKDFSFLATENFDDFVEKINSLNLTQEEHDKLKEQREREIDDSLKKLNQDIYDNEEGLSEDDRVYLVAASIISTMGERPLDVSELRSLDYKGETDGDIIMRRIKNVLDKKNVPQDKIDLITNTLNQTVLAVNINKVKDGETQLKRIFTKITDDLL